MKRALRSIPFWHFFQKSYGGKNSFKDGALASPVSRVACYTPASLKSPGGAVSHHILRTNPILRQWCLLAFLLVSCVGAHAAVDVREFDSEADRARYQSFIDELRCPKCQNQNLAGSDAPIAKDLRDQVYRLIAEGKSDKEIIDFMVERYGEYVLYRPRLSPSTLVLWAGPPVVLIIGIIILILVVRQRRVAGLTNQEAAQSDLSADERAHLNEILNDTDDEKPKR